MALAGQSDPAAGTAGSPTAAVVVAAAAASARPLGRAGPAPATWQDEAGADVGVAPAVAAAAAELPDDTWNAPPSPFCSRALRSASSVRIRASRSLAMADTAAPSFRRSQARVLGGESR